MRTRLFVTSITSLVWCFLFSQSPIQIGQIYTLHKYNSTYTSDTVSVVVKDLGTLTGTVITDKTIWQADNSFGMSLCYYGISSTGQPTTRTDTITLDILTPGVYYLELAIAISHAYPDYDTCQQANKRDTFYLSFPVFGSPTSVIEETASPSLSLTPNPATTQITISISEEHIGSTLTLTDLAGRVVLQSEITNLKSEINIALLPSGIYLATLTTPNGQRAVRKVVKE